MGKKLSTDLKSLLIKAAEKECEDKVKNVKNNLTDLQNLLLKISEQKKYDLTLWVLGEDVDWKVEKNFELLDKAGLITGKMKFYDQSGYLEYSLTDKGKKIVQQIQKQ